MSEITCSTMPVSKDVFITIGDVKLPANLEGEVHFTYTHHPAQNMGGRMEDAIPSDEEVVLDEVELTVEVWSSPKEHIKFVSSSTEFYEEHFGELDCMDVIGYT